MGEVTFRHTYSDMVSDIFRRRFHGDSDGKESPAMQETPVQFLGQEVPLEKG